MLKLKISEKELWDESKQEFIQVPACEIQLEHSLVSLSKWESKWHKSFIKEKISGSTEEGLDYIRCMTITQNVNPNVYKYLTAEEIETISNYINDPMTATTFTENSTSKSNESITSELIYYWMIAYNIPSEYQKWHLNRLITLIRICQIKNSPSKKMSRNDVINRYAALNAARRKQLHSRG